MFNKMFALFFHFRIQDNSFKDNQGEISTNIFTRIFLFLHFVRDGWLIFSELVKVKQKHNEYIIIH